MKDGEHNKMYNLSQRESFYEKIFTIFLTLNFNLKNEIYDLSQRRSFSERNLKEALPFLKENAL